MAFSQGSRQERHIQMGVHDVYGLGSSPHMGQGGSAMGETLCGTSWIWCGCPARQVPSLIMCLVIEIGARGLQDLIA